MALDKTVFTCPVAVITELHSVLELNSVFW